MITTAPPATPQPILDLRKQLLALLSAMCMVSQVAKEWDKEMDVLLGYRSGKYFSSRDPKPTVEYIRQQHKDGGHCFLGFYHKLIRQIGKTINALQGVSQHLQYGMGSDAGPWETKAVKALVEFRRELQEHRPGEVLTGKSDDVDEWLILLKITPPEVRPWYENFKPFYDANWQNLTSDLMDDLDCCAVETAPATDMPADQTSNESRGLALLMDNPNLDIKAIAALLGVKPRTPYKWADFMAAHRRIQQSKRRNLADGFRGDRTGDIEARDE